MTVTAGATLVVDINSQWFLERSEKMRRNVALSFRRWEFSTKFHREFIEISSYVLICTRCDRSWDIIGFCHGTSKPPEMLDGICGRFVRRFFQGEKFPGNFPEISWNLYVKFKTLKIAKSWCIIFYLMIIFKPTVNIQWNFSELSLNFLDIFRSISFLYTRARTCHAPVRWNDHGNYRVASR